MGKQVVKLRSNIAWYFFWTFSQILAIFFPWLMVPIKWPKWRAQDCQDILAGKKILTSWRKHLWSLQLPNYTVEYSKEQNWQEFARIWIRSVMSVASKTNNCSWCFIHSFICQICLGYFSEIRHNIFLKRWKWKKIETAICFSFKMWKRLAD